MNFKTYSNADAVVIKLLSCLKAPVTSKMVMSELEIHPDYPSLLAVSDVLNHFNIENSAIRIGVDDLPTIPRPFIAHFTSKGGEFLLVEDIDAENVFVSNEHWSKHKLSHTEFKSKFGKVVLTVQPPPTSSQENWRKTQLKERFDSLRLPFVIGGVVILPFLVVLSHPSYFFLWQLPVFMLCATIGLITAILLLIQSIDNNNPLIERLCQSGSKTNCNAILTSNAAKIFDWLTWSEVGFFYFAGSWLMLFCNPGSVNTSSPYLLYTAIVETNIAINCAASIFTLDKNECISPSWIFLEL